MIRLTDEGQILKWTPFPDVEIPLDHAQIRECLVKTPTEGSLILARLVFGRLVNGKFVAAPTGPEGTFLQVALNDHPEVKGENGRVKHKPCTHVADILSTPKSAKVHSDDGAHKHLGRAIEQHLLGDCAECRVAGYLLKGELV